MPLRPVAVTRSDPGVIYVENREQLEREQASASLKETLLADLRLCQEMADKKGNLGSISV